MIRVNLLPIKQDRRREAGRNQIFIGLAAMVAEIAVFVVLLMNATDEVDQQRNKNEIVSASVTRIEQQIKDHSQILAEIAEFEQRQRAIDELHAARSGPVFVMLELSNILSREGRPHINPERYQQMIQVDPAAGYDESWDTRRLWIDSFQEKDRKVTLVGQALTHEDVAEFLRRISLSDFFVSSQLVSTNLDGPRVPMKNFNPKGAAPVVHFVLTVGVRYQ
ncbi:MAG: PilN domain-containing protein [Deltaproteobacteria bacterium]|nr:PilN domain-containing protein [Deltaproteobacteria bacterium]